MQIELFHRQECPYSAKVRRFIEAEGLKSQIKYHEIDKEEGSDRKLLDLTGDEQVPCLVVDGKPILESDDIVDWLEDHKDDLRPLQ
jgi:glutathione S-transferase